jgi:PAS domain S-box-containing protein
MINLFSPPSFQEAEATRKAGIFYNLVWGFIFILTCLELFDSIILPQNLLRWLAIFIVFNSTSLYLLFLNKKGKTRIASFLFIALCLLITFSLSFTSGGMKSPTMQYLPIIVLITGILLGWKTAKIIGLIAIMSGLGFILMEYTGFLPVSRVVHTSFSLWIISILCISCLALMLHASTTTLDNALMEAQKELVQRKNSESFVKSISSNISSGMIYQIVIQPNGERKFTYLSESVKELYGITPEEGMANAGLIYSKVYKDDLESMKQKEFESMKTLSEFKAEFRIQNPSGEIRWSSLVSTPRLMEDNSICFDGIEFVITDRKKAEVALAESEEKYRFLMENMNEVVMMVDNDDRVLFVNKKFTEKLGYTPDEIIGKTGYEILLDPCDHQMIIEENKKRVEKLVSQYEICFKGKQGQKIDFLISGAPILDADGNTLGSIGTMTDITDKKIIEKELEKHQNHLEMLVKERTEELHATIEELNATNEELYNQKEELQSVLNALHKAQYQLVQSEKMASLGVLSAGVAHEINNPLNFIQGGIWALETYFKETLPEHVDKVNPLINAINVGVKRASDIVSSLSHYSRNDNLPKGDCNIHEIIENCLIMLRNQLKNKVEVKKVFTEKQHTIIGNEGKLHQALLNIISNAEQSIENSGTIEIKTEVVKDHIVVAISDSGTGINEENIKKIFDPFFTTKGPGKGTGLGLSITYNIIHEHNGSIKYESQPGIGTKAIIKGFVVR